MPEKNEKENIEKSEGDQETDSQKPLTFIVKKSVKPEESVESKSDSVVAVKRHIKKPVPKAPVKHTIKIKVNSADSTVAPQAPTNQRPPLNSSNNNNTQKPRTSAPPSSAGSPFVRKPQGSGPPPPNNNNAPKRDAGKKRVYDKRYPFRDDKIEAAKRQESRTYTKLQAKKLQQEQRLASVEKEINIMESITVGNLAKKMNLRASDIISKLIPMGIMARVNDIIDADTATIIADDFGCKINVISLHEEATIDVVADNPEDLISRPPVVTIMGHVDHGKTSLLDAIRKSNVTSSESGGITQNIGAYKVKVDSGEVAFIDTPGHAAFTMMRARGAKSTDIVILVVAADDGVMPQTIEALNHAKEAKVPIIVAVNKMDTPDATMEKIKSQLSEHGLIAEEWGGETQFVGVSAKTKEGIPQLLEAIILQSEVLELKANPDRDALGVVLEASLDSGRGAVGTVLVQNGTLRIGDYFVCGLSIGKVRAMIDDTGRRIKEAKPSTPVEVLGFQKTPLAGEDFNVVADDKEARGIVSKRELLKQHEALKSNVRVTLDNLYEKIASESMREFKVIIKADVQGSAEALRDALTKIQSDKIRFVSIYAASGAVSESDVNLAHASNALIISYRVRPSMKARDLADKLGVSIEKYDIIYEAIESIQRAMKGSLDRVKKEIDIATIEVRDIFRIPKVGVIAGCYVTSGKAERNAGVRIIRDGILINTSKITSLKRLKDDVKEVASGYECGASIDNFSDLKKGDVLEVFKVEEIVQEL